MKNIKLIKLLCIILILASGCAKENLPTDQKDSEPYKKLYMPNSTEGIIINKAYTVVGKKDTVFYLNKVTLGGNIQSDSDINVQFKILPKVYVDEYNLNNNTAYQLLPDSVYTMQSTGTIKKGTNTTGALPIKIDLTKIQTLTNYLIPVTFTSTDTTNGISIDKDKRTVYFAFWAAGDPTGYKIGNIPQIGDKRTSLFDFYGDLMMRDTVGDLWVYPLENNGNETIGTPYKIAEGYQSSKMGIIFFNHFYGKLIYVDRSRSEIMYQRTITPHPDVKQEKEFIVEDRFKTWFIGFGADYGFGGRMYSYVTGAFAGVYHNNEHIYFGGIGTDGRSLKDGMGGYGFRTISSGWGTPSGHKIQACIGNNVLSMSNVGLLIYNPNSTVNVNVSSLQPGGSCGGSDFHSTYLRMFAIKNKDLIFYKANGDIIRYKDFDITVNHTATQ